MDKCVRSAVLFVKRGLSTLPRCVFAACHDGRVAKIEKKKEAMSGAEVMGRVRVTAGVRALL